MGGYDQLWSHLSGGPLSCLAPGATEMGNCWGVAVLCPLGTRLWSVECASRAGLFGELCRNWVGGARQLFQQAEIK